MTTKTALTKKSAPRSTPVAKAAAAEPTKKPAGRARALLKELPEKYRAHATDTGSTEVQIALLSERIASLAKHLKEHAGDHDSRRGLLMMVGRRRRLLNYLKKDDLTTYQKLIADLGLRK